ncbi:helix-turn-helix domain-containing protein [Cellulomonas sp. NPDC089187]|uniref:helix-turn-helix domain-containing protein n=1 Tax=Cellulomonas sp. NPDC089187 TaxID=3154970 RepID=UPI0034288DFA
MLTTWTACAPGPDPTVVAGALADRTRAAVCMLLMDGRAWTASELARRTDVARSTMTEHLHRLVDSGLLTEEHQGRHRYVRLSGPDAAALIETLCGWSPTPELASTHRAPPGWEHARTCYDHLAGRLGVSLHRALLQAGRLSVDGPTLTAAGRDWLDTLGIDLPTGSRPEARACVDWTERRPHLAGSLGAALLRHACDHSWLARREGRRLVVTRTGHDGLHRVYGIDPDDLGTRHD